MTMFKMEFDTAQLERNIRLIKPKFQRGALRAALRKACQPILKAAQAKAPVNQGDYKRSLGISATVKVSTGEGMVGARRGRKYGVSARISHLLEFGTKQRRRRSGGRTGRIRAMGFARRAFDKNVTAWFERVGKALGRRLERARR